MADSRSKPTAEGSVSEEAAAWLLRLQSADCTDRDRNEFEAWLRADESHAQEYEALREVWELTGELKPTFAADSGTKPAAVRGKKS